MGASPSRRACAQEVRSLPKCLDAANRLSNKVVRANQKRIVVECLSARRFVIGVVQPNQRVSQKRGEVSECFVDLSATGSGDLRTFGRLARI